MLQHMVRLGEVCSIERGDFTAMTVSQRAARKGPYPLYADNCTSTGIDDYSIEAGGCVMVPAYGSVLGSSGYVMARLEQGRCSVSDAVHALVPHDRSDAAYIYRVVTTSPVVARQVGGSPQLKQLPAAALLSSGIPWPCRSTRDAFVEMMDADDARARELAAMPAGLLARGDEAYERLVLSGSEEQTPLSELVDWQRGTNVPASERGADKPVRVEGPRGKLGRCDEALAGEPAVMVGPAGRTVVSHYVGEPSHPIAEMAYARACDCKVPLSVLLFALRAAGVADDPRAAAHDPSRRMAPDALATLRVRVGDEASRAAFALVGDEILASLAQAEREAEKLSAEHAARVGAFYTEGTVWGNGSCEGCEEARGSLPEAPCKPAVVAAPPADASRPEFGELAPLVDEASSLLEDPSDVAWELAPLAAVRARASASQWAFVAAAAGDWAAPGYNNLVRVLDTVMGELAQSDELLSFLPNLSYQTSLLSPAQIAGLVHALDKIDPACIGSMQVGSLLATATTGERLPQAVAEVFACALRAVAGSVPGGVTSAYVPFGEGEGILDILVAEFPGAAVRMQAPEFSQVLADMLAMSVGGGEAGSRGAVKAAPGAAIAADAFPEWKAALVAAALPDNPGEWCEGPVARDDARWSVLGVPPRNKAAYAWLQQALFHQAPGGATVLLVGNSVLHSTVGSEATLRRALAMSGRLRAVVALPPRLFASGRVPSSLLVMGDEGCSDRVLMVNALDLGLGGATQPVRTLPADAARRIGEVLYSWIAEGVCEEAPGFCGLASLDRIAALDCDLCPWTFA